MKNRESEYWIFTFGCGQEHGGRFVKIYGSYSEARQKMFDRYGKKWAFQYSAKEWDKNVQRGVATETLLEVID